MELRCSYWMGVSLIHAPQFCWRSNSIACRQERNQHMPLCFLHVQRTALSLLTDNQQLRAL